MESEHLEFKQITFSEEYHQKYWAGFTNLLVRYYTYLDRGFGVFNQTKNYILMIFGTYWTIRTMEWWTGKGYSDGLLVLGVGAAAFIGIGFLIIIGRWHLFKAQKAIEFITTQKSTITGYNGYNMAIRQLEILEEINKKLK